jgi:hypothetical protein
MESVPACRRILQFGAWAPPELTQNGTYRKVAAFWSWRDSCPYPCPVLAIYQEGIFWLRSQNERAGIGRG